MPGRAPQGSVARQGQHSARYRRVMGGTCGVLRGGVLVVDLCVPGHVSVVAACVPISMRTPTDPCCFVKALAFAHSTYQRAVDVNRPVPLWYAPDAVVATRLRTVTGGLTSTARRLRFLE
jgi:hypothetical protein